MPSRQSAWGVWVLALLAVALTAWSTARETRREHRTPFGDFNNLQTGGQCLEYGCDPYYSADMNANVAARHEQKPQILDMAPVYPPSSLIVLLPFEKLHWPLAAYVFNALSGIATAFACVMLVWWLRIRVWDPAALVMLAALIGRPIASVMEFANPALLEAALILLACLCLLRWPKSTWGWLLMGVALALKPQLAVGATIVMVCRRDTRVAAVRAICLALLLLVVGIVAYRLRLGSFHFLTSLRWAFGLSMSPGGSSDFATKDSYDFLNLQAAFSLIPHVGRTGANVLAWLTTGAFIGVAYWLASTRDSLRRWPWTMIAVKVAISLLPIYHRGYDRMIALVFVPAAVEIALKHKRLAWVYAVLVAFWIANDTVLAHIGRRWHFATQNGVEAAIICVVLLLSVWWSEQPDLIASEA